MLSFNGKGLRPHKAHKLNKMKVQKKKLAYI